MSDLLLPSAVAANCYQLTQKKRVWFVFSGLLQKHDATTWQAPWKRARSL